MQSTLKVRIFAQIGGSARGYLADLACVGIPTVVDVDGMLAGVARIFIRATLYRERSRLPLCERAPSVDDAVELQPVNGVLRR